MNFKYTAQAIRQLQSLDRATQVRIAKKMRYFAEQADPLIHAKPLEGYHRVYRFRIGDMRIVFEITDRTLYVLLIAKRGDIYQDL